MLVDAAGEMPVTTSCSAGTGYLPLFCGFLYHSKKHHSKCECVRKPSQNWSHPSRLEMSSCLAVKNIELGNTSKLWVVKSGGMTDFLLNVLQVAQVNYPAAFAALSALEISSVRQNQFRGRLCHGEASQEPNIVPTVPTWSNRSQ